MIIAFLGFKQVGKTTASNYLIKKYSFVRHNMKDALVAEIKQNFPDLLRAIADTEYTVQFAGQIDALFINKPPLMRALLQNYGTEVRRKENSNYWVSKWASKYWELEKDNTRIVTDDVRFINESKAIKDNGGILIRLTRPDITTGGSHASETEQLEIEADYVIHAIPGDHKHMEQKLDEIMAIELAKL